MFALFIQQSGYVGQQHQLFGLQHLRQGAGNEVRIDVVSAPIFPHANGGYYWNKVTVKNDLQHLGVDLVNLSHVADIDDFGGAVLRPRRGKPSFSWPGSSGHPFQTPRWPCRRCG